MGKRYLLVRGKSVSGPFSGGEIRQMAADGRIVPDDSLREEGGMTLHRAGGVPGLFPAERSESTPPPSGAVPPKRTLTKADLERPVAANFIRAAAPPAGDRGHATAPTPVVLVDPTFGGDEMRLAPPVDRVPAALPVDPTISGLGEPPATTPVSLPDGAPVDYDGGSGGSWLDGWFGDDPTDGAADALAETDLGDAGELGMEGMDALGDIDISMFF